MDLYRARRPSGFLLGVLPCATLVLGMLLLAMSGCGSGSESQVTNPTQRLTKIPLEVVESSLHVAPGGTASLTIATAEDALCFIAVEYKSGIGTATGLLPKRAEGGQAEWTWVVGGNTDAGEWPITVAAVGDAGQAVITQTLVVESPVAETTDESKGP